MYCMVAGYMWIYYSCYALYQCQCQYILYMHWLFLIHSFFQSLTFQTKRNKWIVPGISSMTSGKPRRCLHSNQASFHEETSASRPIHASTLHVTRLSFSFCRMLVFLQALRKLGLKSLYTLCRLRMKQDKW